jgi:hypothetical protein
VRTVLELPIVAGVGVAFRQVASPWVGAWLLMVVFTGSEVDHTPRKSGTKGQLPLTVDESKNCTSFPGTAALWSAVAFDGVIAVVIMHVSLELAQVAINTHKSSRGNNQSLSPI